MTDDGRLHWTEVWKRAWKRVWKHLWARILVWGGVIVAIATGLNALFDVWQHVQDIRKPQTTPVVSNSSEMKAAQPPTPILTPPQTVGIIQPPLARRPSASFVLPQSGKVKHTDEIVLQFSNIPDTSELWIAVRLDLPTLNKSGRLFFYPSCTTGHPTPTVPRDARRKGTFSETRVLVSEEAHQIRDFWLIAYLVSAEGNDAVLQAVSDQCTPTAQWKGQREPFKGMEELKRTGKLSVGPGS